MMEPEITAKPIPTIEALVTTLYTIGYQDITKDNIKDYIKYLTTSDLINIWRSLWPSTRRNFCKKYNLNEGNFSRWLSGKKNSFGSVKAVLLWIMSIGCDLNEEICSKINSESCSIEQVISNVSETRSGFCSIQECIEEVMEIMEDTSKIKAIMFI